MRVFEINKAFGIDNLVLAGRPQPEAGHRQIVVRVRAVSLNYRDLLMVKGLYNPKLPLPRIPFSDGAGDVVAVGEDVTRAAVGDRVAGIFMQTWLAGELTSAMARSALGGDIDGMLAEYVVLSEEGVVHIPEHLSYEEAATLPCAAVTGWHALMENGGLKPGESVLTLGTGGVSLFALQFARLAGAGVIITSRSEEKLARAKEMGARDGINYQTEPDWGERVRELTGGGVDLVVEVGGAGTLPQSLRAVRTGGRISLMGVLTGATGAVNPRPVVMKKVRLQGILVGSREMFEAMNRAITLHRLHPVVDRVFPFEETREALHYMESGAHFGKICIRIA